LEFFIFIPHGPVLIFAIICFCATEVKRESCVFLCVVVWAAKSRMQASEGVASREKEAESSHEPAARQPCFTIIYIMCITSKVREKWWRTTILDAAPKRTSPGGGMLCVCISSLGRRTKPGMKDRIHCECHVLKFRIESGIQSNLHRSCRCSTNIGRPGCPASIRASLPAS
jgi:hypothetical protein